VKARIRIFGVLSTAALLSVVCATLVRGQGTPLRCFYDDLGQLTKVIDPNGNVTTYTYDAVGDILQVSRSAVSSGTLAIFNFSPQQGPVGGTVTIQGQNFSTTPTNDTVKFNGAAAVVVSATAATLVVMVPTGATTGPISVTLGGTTVTSAANFTFIACL
jgi:YD repeat-containing protein